MIAGDRRRENRLDQLDCPNDVLIDKETNSVLIAYLENQQVLRWSRHQGTTQGEVIIDNTDCFGLAIDHRRYFYVFDIEKDEVRRYTIGGKNGIVVAGGNGQGNQLNQLSFPTYLFVDEEQAMYVRMRMEVDEVRVTVNFIRRTLRRKLPSENRFSLESSIFQKAHNLVALSVLFQNTYKLYMSDTYLGQFWRVYLTPSQKLPNLSDFSLSYRELISSKFWFEH